VNRCPDFPYTDALVNALDAVIENSDVVFECTGDPFYAATTVGAVLDAGIPVVTMNSEFHSTIGSHFVQRGLLSEAEGDQPGSLAALYEDAVALGFTPLVCANMKAFLNLNPTPEEMDYWAKRQNYSLEMVTSFTDGTKVQIEQCLVANGLGMDIAQEGLIGLPTKDLEIAAAELGGVAEKLGAPISDFILDRSLPHGVFIIARHDEGQVIPLRNFKMGDGPYYVLVKQYCLAHLEVFKTIERVICDRRPLLNNSAEPRISVASVAKRELKPGDTISRGCGSFDLRGICVRINERPDHLPICLASDVRIRQHVEPGQIVTMDDVELPESEALSVWEAIRGRQEGTMRHKESA
jgi:predicted homoserine dehydrogenase-like protein